jgi:predicted HTH transcriptional regulator
MEEQHAYRQFRERNVASEGYDSDLSSDAEEVKREIQVASLAE